MSAARASLLLSVMLLSLPASAQEQTRNLIRNGDFEGNLPGAGVDYWSPTPPYPARAEVIEDPTRAHSGARFLRLTPTQANTDGNLYQFIDRVEGAAGYVVELWARGAGASVRVFVYEYGPGLKFLGSQPSEPMVLSDEWQLCRLHYTPREELKNLACAVHVRGGPADVDDIRVTAIGAQIPTPAPVVEKPWWSEQLGTGQRVPAPFTALEVNSGETPVVRCWGRELHLGADPLPARIISQGEELLAGPMRLLVRPSRAQPLALPTRWRVTAAGADRVCLEGRSSASGVSLATTITVDFDGFTRLDVQLRPQMMLELEEMWVEIPLRPQRARLMYHRLAQGGNYYGPAPAQRTAWPFLPVIWLGDHTRGLCWFAEVPRGWRNADGQQRLEWLPGGREDVLRVRLIDLPTPVSEPVVFSFGLLATPPKRPPGSAEDYFVRGGPCDPKHVKLLYLQIPQSGDILQYHLAEQERERVRRFVAGAVREGQRAAAWVQLEMFRPLPGYEQYLEQFRLVPGRIYPPDFVYVCPGSDWARMLLYGLAELQQELGLAGFYFDTGTLSACANFQHGCGYREPDGTLSPSYPIFALHEFKRRLYCLLEERLGQRAFISSLINGHMDLPVLTFDSAAISGEELNGRVRQDYAAALSMEQVSLQYDARTWGLWHQWLPAVTAGQDRDTTDSFLSLALPQHTPLWIAYCDYARVFEVLDALQAFGTRDARFLPPWEAARLVDTGAEGVYVALHVREAVGAEGRGEALLVLSNPGGEARQIEVRVDWRAAGLTRPPTRFVDQLRGEALPGQAGLIPLELPARSFRLVRAGY